MEGTRRPYARSLSKEQPGPKKQKLSVVPNSLDGRPGFNQQRRVHMGQDSNRSDSLHGEHQELVSQYEFALSELTFNSKPIITNLSIIAGENLHAAKAIADTVCAHIIEVAPDRKLPSLYLLDSIVKNIGKDYIKHFASRLPEVFCTAYWQVDPSTHQGMRHLFGTWKAVFPPHVLQMIEKELGFTSTSNGSSSGVAVSRANSQVQRPGHSIHVNPKYLERQQLQTSRARGSGSDIGGSMVSSPKIAEAPRTTTGSKESWADPFAKAPIHPRDQTPEPVRSKFSNMAIVDTDYDSNNIPGLSGVETGRVNESFKEQGLNKPWHAYGRNVSGHLSDQKNHAGKKTGLEGYSARKSTNHDPRLHSDQFFPFGNGDGISQTWKNSEEEEYSWDEMNSKPALAKDNWMSDNDDRLEVDIHYQDPQNRHDTGSRIEDEPSVDSAPQELTQVPYSWSEELHPPEAGSNILGSEDYHTGLRNSSDVASRKPNRSQLSTPPVRGKSSKFPEKKTPGIKATTRPHMQNHGAAPPATNSSIRRMPSPSLSKSNSIQIPYTSIERNQMSAGPPVDPRRPTLQRGPASRDQPSSLRLQPSTSLPPAQQRKHIPSQHGKLEVSELEPSGVGQHSPVQSSPGGLLNARAKDQEFSLGSSIKPSFEEGGSNSANNQVSSLLSSLLAKGLISASSSDKLSSAPSQKPIIHRADIASAVTNICSVAVSSPPLAKGKLPSVTDEQSSFEPAAKPPGVTPQSETETKNPIGFEFRPDVIRKFHPDVVADLVSDLPHRCNICGVKLKFQELLDRHMEWHASRVPEGDTTAKMSRSWYSSSLDWVMGTTTYLHDDSSDVMGEVGELLESCEPMVPADENQCACIFCGELFEDFYSLSKNEWMFKGAVYLDISSSELLESFESNAASQNLIVHSHCMSEDSLHALGLRDNVQRGMVKMEED